jgi:methyl-accepting chemotaxis protein
MRFRLLGGAALALLALAAGACGGGGTTTTEASATAQWASGVCTAFSDWKTSLQTIRSDLQGSTPSSSDLRQAGRQFQDATDTLTQSLKRLGKPDTPAGDEVRSSLDQLSTQLSEGMTTVQDAAAGASGVVGVTAAVSSVSVTLSTMADDISSTVAELRQLDAKGELGQAFHEADSCSALFG